MKTALLTLANIPRYGDASPIPLSDGNTLRLRLETGSDTVLPWENSDGHGPVSDWTTRDKRPGEWLLCSDRHSKRFYDFAVTTAKRDGWGAPNSAGTRGEIAVRAVESDFHFLRDWCEGRWEYLTVFVTLLNSAGEELASDCLGGVESHQDYWRDCALDMATALLTAHAREAAERCFWEARDTVTA